MILVGKLLRKVPVAVTTEQPAHHSAAESSALGTPDRWFCAAVSYLVALFELYFLHYFHCFPPTNGRHLFMNRNSSTPDALRTAYTAANFLRVEVWPIECLIQEHIIMLASQLPILYEPRVYSLRYILYHSHGLVDVRQLPPAPGGGLNGACSLNSVSDYSTVVENAMT